MQPTEHRHPPLLIEENDSLRPTRGVWLLLAAFVIAQIALVVVVFAVDFSPLSVRFLLVASWPLLLTLPILLAGPVMLAIRLRRVRARRAQLQRSEWMVEEEV